MIKGDVQHLVVQNHIFWEVQKILRANPEVAAIPSVFYEWQAQLFAGSTVLGVRRQVDRGMDTISLFRLISLLRDHPKILSREYYMSLYDPDAFSQQRAAANFDKYAGDGAQTFQAAYFETDIADLTAGTTRLQHYADREIAHRDARPFEDVRPQFSELTDAVQLLEKLTIKYYALLKAGVCPTLLPTFQYDWKQIFTFPWITTPEHDDTDGPQTNQES